ncbi:MAG: phosphorylase family protein [Gammaproteobacteria bacterium]
MRFGFIAAMQPEAAVFEAASGQLANGAEYVVLLSGPGQKNAARAANTLLRSGCDALVSWGMAGGVAPALGTGDVVVSAGAMAGTGERLEFAPDAAADFRARLADRLAPLDGIAMSASAAALTVGDKARLYSQFGADTVDLESAAIAYVARSARAGFACVRVVVDDARFDVPAAALAGLADDGSVAVGKTVLALVEHPEQLLRMLRLARHFRRALASLETAARLLTTPA